ncbi:hypothetical protein [Paraburkholderia antibiotica]|uniref:Uncharacterized protein n=1 Tax=Paraburkholderia antibiotica TaxID=2728839 RepID=A0A7X9X7T6_9BURK|nr:hypothetical protein [Paraburkholderia antibiotica]NML32970.1 hypothetical protein [Paraburkholderia antibiotica]
MDHMLATLSGSSQAALIDRDIAHIARVMHVSLRGDFGGPILPPAYWRRRLNALLDAGHLSHAQLCKVDGLLLQLAHFEATPQPEWERFAPAVAAPFQPACAVETLHSA